MVSQLTDDELQLILTVKIKTMELQNPVHAGGCPDCLFFLAQTLSQAGVNAVNQPACHDFWDACMSTVTMSRTADDIVALRKKLRTNAATCRAGERLYDHDTWSHSDLADPLHRQLHALYGCLVAVLLPNEPGQRTPLFSASGPKKIFGNTRGRWPTHPKDLFPHGERQSTKMLLHWCCELFSPAPIVILKRLLFSCRPMMFPHLLESPLREQFLWCIVQMLNADTGRDTFAWPATVGYRRPERLPSWLCSSSGTTDRNTVTSLFKVISSGPDAGNDDVRKLYAGYEAALLPAVHNALDMVQNRRVEPEDWDEGALCHLACFLCKRTPGAELHPLARAWRARRAAENEADTFGPLQASLKTQYYRRTCFGPSCTRGIQHTEDARPLPLCSKCKFTQYCSMGCQRADWKRETWPHKDLCPILRTFVPVLEKEANIFEEAFFTLDLELSRIPWLLRWVADQ